MSGNNYTINTDNLFDDADDEIYLNNSSHSAVRVEEQNRILQENRRKIENDTIESSKRTIQTLADTEIIGVATAEELARQREQLVRTNQNLDETTSNLSVSQKYINGIKSKFGGLKFFLSPPKDTPNKSSSLIVSNNNNSDVKQEIYNQKSTTNLASTEECYNSQPGNHLRNDVVDNVRSQVEKPQRSVDEQLNSNLDVIAGSVTRLIYLAKDIGNEIEASNELLGVIDEKMQVVDIRINEQNKEINSLLRKK